MDLTPKPASASATEMTQVVLPNDTNPLGFMLGGTLMHLIDIAAALAANRHTRSRVVTVAVDGLQFLHSIKVGDIVILEARVTATFNTSLEVEVDVFSEEMLTGVRRFTTHAYLTFVSVDADGAPIPVAPLIFETEEDRGKGEEACLRREARLDAKRKLLATPSA